MTGTRFKIQETHDGKVSMLVPEHGALEAIVMSRDEALGLCMQLIISASGLSSSEAIGIIMGSKG